MTFSSIISCLLSRVSRHSRQVSLPNLHFLRIAHRCRWLIQMETFHLLHLARSYNRNPFTSVNANVSAASTVFEAPPVPQTRPPAPSITRSPAGSSTSTPILTTSSTTPAKFRPPPRGSIYAAAAQMVFASRITTNAFITPGEVLATQEWAGKACLEALIAV